MAQHTPGPWQAIGTFIGTSEADYQTVAYASDHRNRRPWRDGEQEANARLIAAAPDMLEALRAVQACPMAAPWLSAAGVSAMVADAIAKAEGTL